MNVIAIIVLFGVSLECIPAARRVVNVSPTPPPSLPQKTPVENLPSSNISVKTNISHGSAGFNVPPMAKENTLKSAEELPSSKTDQQKSKNNLKNVEAPASSQSLNRSRSRKGAKDGANRTAVSEPKTTENSLSSIPYLKKGKETIVKGAKGKVFVDDVFQFDFDDKLKEGKFRFQVNETNDVLVNGRLVLKKRPEDRLIILVNPNIDEDGITEFQVRVDKNGYLYYTSNKGVSKTFIAGK